MAQGGKLGFGIIGAGAVGQMHARVVNLMEDAELVAVTALPFEAAESFCQEFGGGPCRSVEELIQTPGVDVVSICTPSGLHPEHAAAAARAGKHVLVEKPIAVSLEGADLAIKAAEDTGVKLGVISQRRFDPTCRAIKHAVEGGRFGRLVLINGAVKYYREPSYYSSSDWRGTWKLDGGGALINQGIHTVDLVKWLGGPVKSICASARTLSHKIEVEDTACALVEFASGALGSLQSTTSAYPGLHIRVELMGDKGSAILQDSDIVFWQTEDGYGPPDTRGDRTGSGSRDPMAFSHAGHLAQFQDFVGAIRDGRAPLVDGNEGRETLEIVLAAYESSRRGQRIGLPL